MATSTAVALPLLGQVSPALAADVSSLNPFERQGQKAAFQKLAEDALKEVLTSADSPACIRLVFNDAATYNSVTKTGGMDGSIVLSSELDRPENAMLKPLVEKLKAVKATIDAAGVASGAGAISWADLLVLAGKVSTQQLWAELKIARAQTRSGGEIIVDKYSSPWSVVLGRVDSAEAAPGRVPAPDASVEDIKQFMLLLGADPAAKPGPFTPKAPFWEKPGFVMWTASALDPVAEEARFAAAEKVFADAKRKYDISRGTITRTDYEVDFINLYNMLTTFGAKFNRDAYLHA